MRRAPFRDRAEAAWELAEALQHYSDRHPLVLAVPRGGVPMGRIIADALGGDLDVLLVKKIGAPDNPELAIGAVDEAGRLTLNDYAALVGVSSSYVNSTAAGLQSHLAEWRLRHAGGQPAADVRGRTVIVVDDGVATGATMVAALEMVRARDPGRLVCAVPVASPRALARVDKLADEVVCLSAPDPLDYIGAHYLDFRPVTDAEVAAALRRPTRRVDHAAVIIPSGRLELPGEVSFVENARGLVLFIHASGSCSASRRHHLVADVLNQAGFSTVLLDLLSAPEARQVEPRFDIDHLFHRVEHVIDWVATQPEIADLPIGLMATGTGAAVALTAATQYPEKVQAVVARGGRPDLARASVLRHVRAPTLLMVGAADTHMLALNQKALEALSGTARLDTIPAAGHHLEEARALENAANRAVAWFGRHLTRHLAPGRIRPHTGGAVAADSALGPLCGT